MWDPEIVSVSAYVIDSLCCSLIRIAIRFVCAQAYICLLVCVSACMCVIGIPFVLYSLYATQTTYMIMITIIIIIIITYILLHIWMHMKACRSRRRWSKEKKIQTKIIIIIINSTYIHLHAWSWDRIDPMEIGLTSEMTSIADWRNDQLKGCYFLNIASSQASSSLLSSASVSQPWW